MTGGLVFASIAERSGALVILDAGRRLYAGLSRNGSYWHVVTPSQVEIHHDETDEVIRGIGQLFCTCKGGTFHGSCYRLEQAVAFEAGDADRLAAPAWMRDIAPETELERAAARG